MDVVASSSLVQVSPLKKRKRLDLGALTLSEKQCVINMYKQMLSGKTKVKTCEIVSKIMNAMGEILNNVRFVSNIPILNTFTFRNCKINCIPYDTGI